MKIKGEFYLPIFEYRFMFFAGYTSKEIDKYLYKFGLGLGSDRLAGSIEDAWVIHWLETGHIAMSIGNQKSRAVIHHEVNHLVYQILKHRRSTPMTDDTDETYRRTEEYIYMEIINYLKKKKFRLKE